MLRPVKYYDLQTVNKWRAKHGQSKVQWHDLPAIGYYVPGVAFGFLRVCEGGYGIFDSMITNPYASSHTRHTALQKVYNRILSTPGFHTILGFTTDKGALERALSNGFKLLPQATLVYTKG